MSPLRPIVPELPALSSLPAAAPATRRGTASLLLGLLVSAVALQNIAWVVLLHSTDWRWPHLAAVFAIGLALAQIGMAGLWLALARGPLWQRGLIMIAAILLGGPLAALATNGFLVHWCVVTTIYAAITACPLLAARCLGVHLAVADDGAVSDPRLRQFTIRAILVLTTCVAALLGIGRILDYPWRQIGETAQFGLALGLIPWILGPLSLRTHRRTWPVLAAIVVCPLSGYLIDLTGFPPRNQIALLIGLTTVQGVLTLGMAAVVRLAGQRLQVPAWRIYPSDD
jgi:hypothetical protein